MKVEGKRKCTLYCYVTGVRFEDYEQDFLVEDGFVISRNDDDTVVNLLKEKKYDYFCKTDYQKMQGCGLVMKVQMKDDEKKTEDMAIKKIVNFLKVLRVIQPNEANPHYFIMHYHNGDVMSIGPPDTLATCHSLERNLYNIYTNAVNRREVVPDNKKEDELFQNLMKLFKIYTTYLIRTKDLQKNIPQIFENNHRVRIALDLYDTAFYERYREFRTLFFAMALESLFATPHTELTFSLDLRISRFLAKEFRERKKIFNKICCAYVIRSKIVHGLVSKLKPQTLKFGERTFREYLRKSLLTITQNKQLIDLFDNSIEHKRYLKQLVLQECTEEDN